MSKNSETNQLVRLLVERLIQDGLDPQVIPMFVRFLASVISIKPSLSSEEINGAIKPYKGWRFRIDDEIVQLTWACVMEISLCVPDHLISLPLGFSHVIS